MKKDDNYSVYKHTSPSGKVYIGITKQIPEKRWQNGKGYSDNLPFAKAIKKYGWDNIKHEILYSGLNKDAACELEIKLIQDYQATDDRYGYNLALGGNANSPTEATKKKTSNTVKELWQTDDIRQKMIAGMQGKKRSDVAKKNIAIAQKKRFENPEQRKAISERQIGTKRSEHAKQKTSQSLKAFYKDPINAEKHKAEMAERNKKLRKKVLCIETGVVYDGITSACIAYGLTHQNLSACLKGKRKTFGGHHWKYAE